MWFKKIYKLVAKLSENNKSKIKNNISKLKIEKKTVKKTKRLKWIKKVQKYKNIPIKKIKNTKNEYFTTTKKFLSKSPNYWVFSAKTLHAGAAMPRGPGPSADRGQLPPVLASARRHGHSSMYPPFLQFFTKEIKFSLKKRTKNIVHKFSNTFYMWVFLFLENLKFPTKIEKLKLLGFLIIFFTKKTLKISFSYNFNYVFFQLFFQMESVPSCSSRRRKLRWMERTRGNKIINERRNAKTGEKICV